jgi:hypothetical protein
MTVAVNACADAYDEKAKPQGPPTLSLTVPTGAYSRVSRGISVGDMML